MKIASYKYLKQFIAATFLVTTLNPIVSAGPIITAIGAAITSGASYDDIDNDINNTFNQSGLYDNYINNVTDFDSYLALNPYHTSDYNQKEWFSAGPSVSVTYDLGRLVNVNAIALWNEETTGFGLFDLFGSKDGISFHNLASSLSPTNNPFDISNPNEDYRYTADRFNFTSTNLQYVRFDASYCRDETNILNYCSIGEVGFRTAEVSEPETLVIFCLSLLGLSMRRKGCNGSFKKA